MLFLARLTELVALFERKDNYFYSIYSKFDSKKRDENVFLTKMTGNRLHDFHLFPKVTYHFSDLYLPFRL